MFRTTNVLLFLQIIIWMQPQVEGLDDRGSALLCSGQEDLMQFRANTWSCFKYVLH